MAYAMQPITISSATVSITADTHGFTPLIVDRAAGVTATLPAASGSGVIFYFFVKTTITSNNFIIQVANASDTMAGFISSATTTTGAGTHEAVGGTDDTITMNGTTTGGIAGSYVEVEDVATNLWRVNGHLVGSGTLATPVSAAVS